MCHRGSQTLYVTRCHMACVNKTGIPQYTNCSQCSIDVATRTSDPRKRLSATVPPGTIWQGSLLGYRHTAHDAHSAELDLVSVDQDLKSPLQKFWSSQHVGQPVARAGHVGSWPKHFKRISLAASTWSHTQLGAACVCPYCVNSPPCAGAALLY